MPIAGKNAIHILRGANVKTNSSIATLTLSEGQPLYDTQTGYLYIGEGNTIANTAAVKASYADNANLATYATGLTSTLSINSGGTGGTNARTAMKNLMMNVGASTNPGNSEYLVFATSTTAYRYNYGYIKNDILSEVSTSSVTNANYANFANIANSVESNLNIRIMGTNYTYNGSSLVNIRSRNIVATNTSVDRGAIPYANTNGTTTTAANVTWLAKGSTGQVLTATSTGIAWRTLSTSSLPSFITTIDNSDVDLPITASTYMVTKVIGANGFVSVEVGGSGAPTPFGDNNLITIGIRPGSNQITVSYSNGTSVYYTAPSSMTRIALHAPPNTKYVVTKLSDD